MLLNLGLGVGGIVPALVVSEADPPTFVWPYLADATAYLAYFAVLLTLPGVDVGRVSKGPLEEGGGSDPRPAGMREVLADRILRRVLLLAAGIFDLGETLWAPVAHLLVNDLAPEQRRGRYNSSMSVEWSLSSIIGLVSQG